MLLDLHARRHSALNVRQENGRVLLLFIRVDLSCVRHFPLRNLETTVQVDVRRSAYQLLSLRRETLSFLFRDLSQDSLPTSIPSVGAFDRSRGCSIDLNRLGFDVIIG